MPLIIDDNIIKDISTNLNIIFYLYQKLKNNSESVIKSVQENSQSVTKLETQNYILYVHQKEYIILNSKHSKLKIIGSDEATTCHIILLREKSSDIVMAHIDSEKGLEEWLERVSTNVSNLKNENTHPTDDKRDEERDYALGKEALHFEVWIYGGYADEDGISEKITTSLLTAMCNSLNATFEIVALCTGKINTRYIESSHPKYVHNSKSVSIPVPIITGMAYDINPGRVQASHPNPYPALFVDKGPDALLRSARNMLMGESPTMPDGEEFLVDITPRGPPSDQVTLTFHYKIPKLANGILLAMLPDEALLNDFSTSPQAESDFFLPRLRQMFRLLHYTPGSPEFLMGDSLYQMNNLTGEWIKKS